MTQAFTLDSSDASIILIESNQFDEWLGKQPEKTQNWLTANNFKGKGHQAIPGENGDLNQIIYGIEDPDDFFIAGDLPTLLPPQTYSLDLNQLTKSTDTNPLDIMTRFAASWGVASYQYDRYKSNDKTMPVLALPNQTILNEAIAYTEAIKLVRDLVNTPAADMMPEHLGTVCEELAKQFGAEVNQIIGDELLESNHPTIHAVGRASVHAPRLIDMYWGDADAPKITLIGKGVCFDSGGLDLKPGNFMRLMKKDMGGAAHVLGLAHLIMSHELPVRLRVLIPAVENAVSSNAFRPGDVIKTRKGITVEIDNTDAEGRLVLCDAIALAEEESPDLIVDYATLTGACRVALGTELPGFFCNQIELAKQISECGEKIADPIWQLPLHKPYQDMLKSDVADTLNSSPVGFAGAITAALYLQLFVSAETPWLHFDVMAWNNRKLPGRPVGGEAFGVRAMFQYLKDTYQS